MTDKEIYSEIVQLLENGEELILATIVSKEGPTPAALSSKMIVKKSGFETVGTVGGGCLEAEIIKKAQNVMRMEKPEIVKYRLEDEDPESWLICGGTVEILVEPISLNHKPIFEKAVTILMNDSRGVFCTVISENLTKKSIISGIDWFGEKPLEKITKRITSEYDTVIGDEKPQKIKGNVFLDPLIPPVHVFIFGGGHVSLYLSQVTKSVGFHVTVIDDRMKFTDKKRFPHVDNTLCADYEEVFEKIDIDGNSYLIIVTRGHKHDALVLEKALNTEASYIGMIGSRKKVITLYKRLIEKGFDRKKLEKVFSPIGLDIGAKTPEEIAISIVSELIKFKRKGREKEIRHCMQRIVHVMDKI